MDEEEEEEEDPLKHSNRHRKLNFNAPLLSTRRHPNPTLVETISPLSASRGSSDRSIPFSWEQAPGKPKQLLIRSDDVHDTITTPRLRVPPSRWPCPPLKQSNELEGDDDDDDDENDVYSLSEAIDIVERAEKADKLDGQLKLRLEEYSREAPSPSFMIERFLPDATALAASSGLNFLNNTSSGLPLSSSGSYSEKTRREPCSSPKGRGRQGLLPNWRIKHMLCGVKSPVSVQTPCTAKQKKR